MRHAYFALTSHTVHASQALIGFVTALEDGKYSDAMARLEGLDLTPETEAMWQQLQEVALGAGELTIAERCSAALGDVCRARFLHKTSKVRAPNKCIFCDGVIFLHIRSFPTYFINAIFTLIRLRRRQRIS